MNQFCSATMIARTTLGTHYPRISAQTVTHRLQEIGERSPYTMYVLYAAFLFWPSICALWSPAGKGLTSWLSFVVSAVSLSLSHWYPGSGVVLDCIDS